MAEKIVDVHVHPFAIMTNDHLLAELGKAGVDVVAFISLGLARSIFQIA